MDPEGAKFGRGPRELTGAVDLINHYKLHAHHEFFCKRLLPVSISDTHYTYNVVGDTEIRKGDGMQLDQLIQSTYSRDTKPRIQPFDLDVLREAFQLKDTAPIDLPPADKGTPTIAGKSKSGSKDKERKHKKHRDKDRGKDKDKDKEHKKHKHRHKDRSKDKEKEKKKDKHDSGGEPSKKHEKKRKHDGDEDLTDVQRQKKT
ncbi:mediator of RNA polymerase II transcription subunit 19a isoform X2 [Argentina anserina]|uniref:mediator of RNA polymerase II transcription subunit 19a isoform X2 n=1 Tax=Argentina anserina TaxID=57926 RepID=UPI0021766500|nr:mediator of RNA polymerase II transcription subunit 19a isoform X2 [Potentilla anserina]